MVLTHIMLCTFEVHLSVFEYDVPLCAGDRSILLSFLDIKYDI